jgi:hypothetical protein
MEDSALVILIDEWVARFLVDGGGKPAADTLWSCKSVMVGAVVLLLTSVINSIVNDTAIGATQSPTRVLFTPPPVQSRWQTDAA